MSEKKTKKPVTNKPRKPRKKKEQLKGVLASGVIFIGDAEFFAGSPTLELDASTGEVRDCTPKDPLNPFNTLDRTLELVGDSETNVELGPFLPGRGVLINTHLQQGNYVVKKKRKDGKLVGFTVSIIE